MQACLDNAPKWMSVQTPKEYVQQLAAASEALRRAGLQVDGKTPGKVAGKEQQLSEFRRIFDSAVNGQGGARW